MERASESLISFPAIRGRGHSYTLQIEVRPVLLIVQSPRVAPIDIAFIDGSHAYENVKYDFLHTIEHTHKNSYILLHDSNIYVREIIGHAGVKKWLKILRKEKDFFEITNFPFSSGMALVHILQDKAWGYSKS